MPESLSRDLCERLARAYPQDIGAHEYVDGDLFWRRGQAQVWVAFIEADTYWGGAWPIESTDVWCPRLEDLLELAQEVNGHLWEMRRIFGGACIFSANNVARDGDTPVESVALWLLAQREGAR